MITKKTVPIAEALTNQTKEVKRLAPRAGHGMIGEIVRRLGNFKGSDSVKILGMLHEISLVWNDKYGGYTIERHCGKTVEQLLERLEKCLCLPACSTFTNVDMAEKYINEVLKANEAKVIEWLKNPNRIITLKLHYQFDESIGFGFVRNEKELQHTRLLTVLLKKDEKIGQGLLIKTAFPKVKKRGHNIDYSQKYPELCQFLACYFNPDWDLDYSTAEEAIQNFIVENNRRSILRVYKEISLLFEEELSPQDLEEVLFNDFYYDYGVDKITSIDWLKWAQEKVIYYFKQNKDLDLESELDSKKYIEI